jgi:SHAQKYF class myb-like DNA-binding protein
MSEANHSELPTLSRKDSAAELPIRDAVQSHQASDVRTNDYENPSVFASVSTDVPPIQVPTNILGTISNDGMVDSGIDAVTIDDAFDTAVEVHSSVQSSPLSLNGDAAIKGTVPINMSHENSIQESVTTVTKQKKRRRHNVPSTPSFKSNGSDHLSSSSAGRWTAAEHHAFVRGLAIYGREWKRVAQDIPTRTSAQVRSHAQKYFTKLEKQMSSNASFSLVTHENDRLKDVAMSPRNHSLGSSSYSSTDEGDLNSNGMPNDGYATMSDSVRREAARILANPATVELEVRDTLERLRIRYEQLKERLEVQKQQSSPSRQQEDARLSDMTTNGMVQEDDELIALHVLQGLQQHVELKRSSHDTPNGVNPQQK